MYVLANSCLCSGLVALKRHGELARGSWLGLSCHRAPAPSSAEAVAYLLFYKLGIFVIQNYVILTF